MTPPLSVLDLSPIGTGSSSGQALRNSVELAQLADRLGYRRYWVAEHHNMPGVASAAPEILIAVLARETARIRVGSGGIMLPNHAPLKVAENFRLLEALYPGRIDLGIGRAPGSDRLTALALRRSPQALGADDLPSQLGDLLAFASGGFPAGHPFQAVSAMPNDVPLPPVWLLGFERLQRAGRCRDRCRVCLRPPHQSGWGARRDARLSGGVHALRPIARAQDDPDRLRRLRRHRCAGGGVGPIA